MASLDFRQSAGSLLVGGLFASLLTGFVMAQTYMYYKTYSSDSRHLKLLVLTIWCSAATLYQRRPLWSYLIQNFGNSSCIDIIHWNIALTILVTAIVTFMVQLFFAYRIFMLSTKNYLIAAPIVILTLLRLVSASVSTAEMFHLAKFTRFRLAVQWVFTSGSLSTAVDFLITGSLFILLHTSRTGAANVNALIDALIMYAFETGLLTSAGTVISMICWLAMPTNLVFLGLHFVIGKSYAISLLVTLNMREHFRRGRSDSLKSFGAPVIFDTRCRCPGDPDLLALSVPDTDARRGIAERNVKSTMLKINDGRTLHHDL